MKNLKLTLLVVGLAVAGSAMAQVDVVIDTPNPAEGVNLVVTPATGSAVPAYNSYTAGQLVDAGIYNETINGSKVETPGFCIDVAHDVTVGESFTDYSYTSLVNAADPPAGPMTSAEAVQIEKLWAAYYPAAAAGNVNDAAALQVAIWMTLGNGQLLGNGKPGYTVSDGASLGYTPSATTVTVFNLANSYITSVSTGGSDASISPARLEAIVSPDGQAYVIVPEPTTIIAGAMLLLPFGASTLRFVRRNRAP